MHKIFFSLIFLFFSSYLWAKNNNKAIYLEDAILLAVRVNPNIENTQLEEVLQRFNVYVQTWAFYPHYSLTGGVTYTRTGTPGNPIIGGHNYAATGAVTILTPIGTNINLTETNVDGGNYNPGLSLQITQPLIRGFGTAIVETALRNAMDSESIAQLNIEDAVKKNITNVINSYLNILNAKQTIHINQMALLRAKKSVEQTKLFIKAGHIAGNELVTVEADLASALAQLELSQNNLLEARYALLSAIGIDPNSPLEFAELNIETLIKKYRMPSLSETKQLVLANDISYRVANIILNGSTTRNVLTAEDNTRTILNLVVNAATGNGSGGGQSAGIDSLFNGANQGQSVALTFTIPIDDQLAKQGLLNAKIALKEARNNLQQEKWNKETNAINEWNRVNSSERSLRFAKRAEMLQEKTYQVSYQKYLHGLINSLELQTAQMQLIQAQQNLLNSEITYLKSLVNLDLLTGNTLRTWHVKMRF